MTSIVLAGCASKSSTTAKTTNYQHIPVLYTVMAGDSLSKIAMRYNLDYRDIVRVNQIPSADKIYVGQVLRLRESAVKTNQVVNKNKDMQQKGITNTTNISTKATQNTPSIVVSQAQTSVSQQGLSEQSKQQWVRPAQGEIVKGFGNGSRGLFFIGEMGDPVFAAADGNVVYAANGVEGYGELVIIQHANGYMTTYAHNSRLFVSAGQQVRAGEKIAEIGNTSTDRTWLQFQMRHQGKVIDPLLYF